MPITRLNTDSPSIHDNKSEIFDYFIRVPTADSLYHTQVPTSLLTDSISLYDGRRIGQRVVGSTSRNRELRNLTDMNLQISREPISDVESNSPEDQRSRSNSISKNKFRKLSSIGDRISSFWNSLNTHAATFDESPHRGPLPFIFQSE